VGLNVQQRRENVAGAFHADIGSVQGKRVLLVDDLVTSGATAAACTLALNQAGARQVYVLTLARVG
jgi:predicted amidophosphoribosyltransferase